MLFVLKLFVSVVSKGNFHRVAIYSQRREEKKMEEVWEIFFILFQLSAWKSGFFLNGNAKEANVNDDEVHTLLK